MKHLFVSYELDKLAKEKGLDEDCFGAHILSQKGEWELCYQIKSEDIEGEWIPAHLYQQLVDWFFTKHNIYIEPLFDAYGSWIVWIVKDITKTHKGSGNFDYFDDKHCITNEFHGWKNKYEALTKALEEAFKLIP